MADQPAEMFQSVWITFSDGTKAGFAGNAVVFPGTELRVLEVEFTPPKPLPEGHYFGEIDTSDVK